MNAIFPLVLHVAGVLLCAASSTIVLPEPRSSVPPPLTAPVITNVSAEDRISAPPTKKFGASDKVP